MAPKEGGGNDEYSRLERVASDFMCYVCGALFNTDEDRKQHLEKEMHGRVREGTTAEEMATARHQEEVNESHHHKV
jgi:hypothetical protein